MKIISQILTCTLVMAFSTANAQTTVFTENFESGTLGLFSASLPSGIVVWNNTQIRGGDPGHSPTRSAYFGNPADTSYDTGAIEGGELTSSPVSLMGYSSATLTFNYYLETEAFTGYDIAQALVSTDGVNYTPVASNQASNLMDPSGSWQTASVDISSYAGSPLVYIRFGFNTVDAQVNGFEGFYVDDVVVTAGVTTCNIMVTTTSTNETSAGANDGTATAVAMNGTTPYFYLWSDPAAQTTATATNLAPGVYSVTVIDADSCFATGTVVILAGGGCPNPSVNFAYTLNGLTVNFIEGALVTGTPSYYWDFGDGTGTSMLANPAYTYASGGTYYVCLSVTDSCGNSSYCQNVLVPGGGCTLSVSTTSTNETAAGANDGTGTAVPSGGTAPYFYIWSDPATQTTATATGLAPGFYSVTVIDADSCMATGTVNILAAGACTLSVTASATDETSAGANDGTATAFVSNGTAPYVYIWSDPANQATATATGLAPGTYTVTVVDADTCMATATVTVLPGSVNCQIQLTLTPTDVTSPGGNDGSVSATVANGTQPYTYFWSTGGSTTSPSITGLSPGVYSCTVVDADSCFAGGTVAVQDFVCTLTGTGSSTPESSFGAGDGTASISASGGSAPYAYQWSTSATSTMITGLISGFYGVTITDFQGCTYTTTIAVSVAGCTLTASASGTGETEAGANDGTATVTVSGGTAPYLISWNTFDTSATITNLPPGDYTASVTDSMGCPASATYTVAPGQIIGVLELVKAIVSVKVYPNPAVDLVNFEVTGANRGVLYIFDFAGRLVKEAVIGRALTEISADGLGNGMYFYRIIADGEKLGSGKFVVH